MKRTISLFAALAMMFTFSFPIGGFADEEFITESEVLEEEYYTEPIEDYLYEDEYQTEEEYLYEDEYQTEDEAWYEEASDSSIQEAADENAEELLTVSDMGALQDGVSPISQQPQSQTAASGTAVQFSVAAEGATAYRWQLSNDSGASWINCSTKYKGYNTATVTVSTTDRGGWQFRCLVTINGEQIVSEAATLTVISDIVIDEVKYEKLTENTCRIVSYSGAAETLVIPETVQNMTVTQVGEEAFMGNTTLISIDLPDTITIIHNKAFKNCTALKEMK